MNKTIGIIAIALAGGIAGAIIYNKYKTKKKCACEDKTKTATTTTSVDTPTATVSQPVPPAVNTVASSTLAADGWGVRQK